ncbi:MAG: transcriptional regulator [Nitrospirae bacterium]|nr:transcriptional regulator [Nitrospirota bacterium]
MTVRQFIIAELEKGSMTARDLSKAIRIPEKEANAHMEHVAKSLHSPKRLIIEPPVCNKCGFIFSERRRFTSPSRCPRCRHEGIQPPAFRIDVR